MSLNLQHQIKYIRDARIVLTYKYYNGQEVKVELRLESFYHEEKNKAYYFLTNLFDLEVEQITNLNLIWEDKTKLSLSIFLLQESKCHPDTGLGYLNCFITYKFN